mgnify:CR=1 FL=1
MEEIIPVLIELQFNGAEHLRNSPYELIIPVLFTFTVVTCSFANQNNAFLRINKPHGKIGERENEDAAVGRTRWLRMTSWFGFGRCQYFYSYFRATLVLELRIFFKTSTMTFLGEKLAGE